MTKEELEKDYYADRPTEPYSDYDNPNGWANIAHYAEENLEMAFKRIAELEKENAELKVDKGDLIFVRNQKADYINELKDQFTKAKDFMLKLSTYLEGHTNYDFECELIKEVKQFLKENNDTYERIQKAKYNYTD